MADVEEQAVKPIDVLLVADDDVFNRLGSVVRHICVGMIDEGVRLTVLLRPGCKKSGDTIGPSRVVNLPGRYWFQRRYSAQEVLDFLGFDSPQIVHCMSADLARWIRPWTEEWKSGLLVHMTDLFDVDRFRFLSSSNRTMGVAATASIAKAALEKYLGLEERIRNVPLGIPAQQESVCFSHAERMPVVVLSVPLTKYCGLEGVFKALKSIVQNGKELHLFILETGPAERTFRRLVDQMDLRAYVTFTGRMRDWATFSQALQAADLYLVPSTYRRFGIKTLTAMATGMGILAPVGTIQDYLVDGETASLFDPLKPKKLAAKWEKLLEDRDFTRQLANNALEHVRAHHKASMMVGGIAKFYRDICALAGKKDNA
ncbi:MAG: glycosyltransferase [Planctomycetota bacterium]|nr:MAG: glycosyltransferase [Planctomycetota bacterium]